MYKVEINGKVHVSEVNLNLLTFLREVLYLTSAKDGCAEGACGACMVLVDGKASRACLFKLAQLEGRKVLTLEGLGEEERQIYARAFAEVGAVQCGFCIPGMIISAKALLDHNPHPTPGEVKQAIKGNICRCTGYVKIEQGILLAAQLLRGEAGHKAEQGTGVGHKLERSDARQKALGIAQYVDDLFVEGMLYAGVLRAPCARALIKSIDISQAQAHEGVVAVITADDLPGDRYHGHIFHDWPVLVACGEETRYIGDALALVAAHTKEQAEKALALIMIEYDELEPLTAPSQALSTGAPLLHPNGNLLSTTQVKRGNASEALAGSKHVVTNHYSTPMTEHAFMETESALAVPDQDEGLTVFVGSQSVYDDQRGITAILGLPANKVRVVSKYVGGGFGGKEDLSVQHHAALLALKTGRPVKLTLSRAESLRVHPKRHAMEIELTTGCDAKGRITGVAARIVADTGAYASLGSAVLQRTCTHIAGPYQVPNVDISGLCVYTNNPPAGAFRGFGVPQAAFACESNLDVLARQVGISPWEIRYLNALEQGLANATGQLADAGTALKETLLAVKEDYENNPYAGIACVMKNTGIGVGLRDIGRVTLEVKKGQVVVHTSAACVGQGLATILTQIITETCGIPPETIQVEAPDTLYSPDSGTTTASRQTMFTGEAARQAAIKLREALRLAVNANSSAAGVELTCLEGKFFQGEYLARTDPLGCETANPQNHVAYSYATHVVILNERGKVIRVVAAHDVGRAINPQAVEGQIEGGIAMGLGFALTEDFPLDRGVPMAKYGKLGVWRATEMPEITVRIIEKNQSAVAYGAKGVGEIAAIPVAPAVAAAYFRFDGNMRLQLPLKETFYRP